MVGGSSIEEVFLFVVINSSFVMTKESQSGTGLLTLVQKNKPKAARTHIYCTERAFYVHFVCVCVRVHAFVMCGVQLYNYKIDENKFILSFVHIHALVSKDKFYEYQNYGDARQFVVPKEHRHGYHRSIRQSRSHPHRARTRDWKDGPFRQSMENKTDN